MSRSRTPRRTASIIAALSLALTGVSSAHAATSTDTAKKTPAATKAASTVLTQTQAQALAHKSGKAVAIPSSETATTTLQANPNGSFTLTSAAQPVRALVNGTWQNLNATLKKNPDGSLSPTLASEPLTISGGGNAPLAKMRDGHDSLALTLPVALPAPTFAGATATYRNVIPGVDLVVTVTN